ncbi:MAG TPA: hypothetical protein VM165_17325 [Planctomycetaceae bacterium]|nr:hypothetical protein [Planctomycetaceae bacterium]
MNDPEVVRFFRAAQQRAVAAEVLVRDSRFRDATYLGGYVIECSLKSLVLTHVAPRDREAFVAERFHGRRAHDFTLLVELLVKQGQTIPSKILQAVSRAAEIWSVDLRYTPGRGRADEANMLLAAGSQVMKWVEERIR